MSNVWPISVKKVTSWNNATSSWMGKWSGSDRNNEYTHDSKILTISIFDQNFATSFLVKNTGQGFLKLPKQVECIRNYVKIVRKNQNLSQKSELRENK